ncbi:MAG TPA: hypothetical protein VKA68_17260 [bacterium]|nr:hypothetical protein [bacterium]
MEISNQTGQTRPDWQQRLSSFLALFTSTGTLLCCALPAAVSTLAGGAAVIGLTSAFPFLIPLSRSKDWIFLAAGGMILISGILTLRPKGAIACSITGGQGCEVAGKFTKFMFWASVGIYALGAFASYALTPMLRTFGV